MSVAVVAPPRWVPWTAAAFAATLLHRAVDHHIGLFGPTADDLSVHQGAAAVLSSLVLGWWLLAAARGAAGDPDAARAAIVLTGIEALLLNGAVAVLAAPPPSDGFPYQDLAHFSALVCGAVTVLAGRSRLAGRRDYGRFLVVGVALALAHLAVSAPLEVGNT